MKFFWICFGVYFLIQILLTGYFLCLFAQKFSKNNLLLKMNFGIFFLPLFCFFGKNIFLHLKKEFGKDEVELEVKKIFFFINPFYLFLGRVQIFFLKVWNSNIKVTSWIPSQEKISWLPPPSKIKIKRGSIRNANLIFLEKSKLPHSKIQINDIILLNSNFDLAYPTQIFFFSKYMDLKIGTGTVKTELCFPNQGFLKIKNVKWSDLINLGGISIQGLGGEIDLHANYKNFENTTLLRGVFGKKEKLEISHNESKNQRFAFEFSIEWEKFHLPLDLGIYNLIYMIFKNTIMTGILKVTLFPILDFLEKIIKHDT